MKTDLEGFDKEAQKRVKRAMQCARTAAICDPGFFEIKLRRFHEAMDALATREEGEAVYSTLRGEHWYQLAAQALARTK